MTPTSHSHPDSRRPSLPSPEPDIETQVRGDEQAVKANDSQWSPLPVVTPPRRISGKAVGGIRSKLLPRDLALISFLAEVRWATSKQVQRLFFADGSPLSNARRAQACLLRLTELGVLVRPDRRIGRSSGSDHYCYALSAAGLTLIQDPASSGRRRIWTPSATFIDHSLDVTELYVRLHEAHRGGRLELIEFQSEPKCWRDFAAPIGRMTLKPDAYVRIGQGEFEDLWFIEVDRGTESVPALLRKFRVYRQYHGSGKEQHHNQVFPRVLWLAPNLKRLTQLIDAVSEQPADAWKLFGVRLFDEAIDHLSQERPA